MTPLQPRETLRRRKPSFWGEILQSVSTTPKGKLHLALRGSKQPSYVCNLVLLFSWITPGTRPKTTLRIHVWERGRDTHIDLIDLYNQPGPRRRPHVHCAKVDRDRTLHSIYSHRLSIPNGSRKRFWPIPFKNVRTKFRSRVLHRSAPELCPDAGIGAPSKWVSR